MSRRLVAVILLIFIGGCMEIPTKSGVQYLGLEAGTELNHTEQNATKILANETYAPPLQTVLSGVPLRNFTKKAPSQLKPQLLSDSAGLSMPEDEAIGDMAGQLEQS